ncbi:CYFA0S01e00958g1_1 [Cyberlindnera fabianii]|uniref:CYFA0S01e00958g1_1 n=1 Tax=Cyberlindnera fabianii TaxID=36022 RepID=A0A061AM21_CYBFA|nr:CYFA0S01e00958g1_1 [Cyberlindnera fabianii]
MTFVLMMDSTYRDLATRTLSLLKQTGEYRIIILLVGAPGSGKSTIAQRVVDILNEQHSTLGKHHSEKHITGGDLLHSNDDLPKYDPSTPIDIEDDNYTPTIDHDTSSSRTIIRGRGGDDTAIKIESSCISSHNKDSTFAQVIPMDGFHLPRSILTQFKDSTTAILRRGSPFTFDSSLVVRLVSTLNDTLHVNAQGLEPLDTCTTDIPDIYIPSFDHAEHDPKQYGTKIHGSARVLIMEGLYLLLDDPVWGKIARCLEPSVEREEVDMAQVSRIKENNVGEIPVPNGKNHEFWKILIDDSKMLQRVGKRHVKAGIVKTLEEGEERVKVNDLPNGKRVYRESFRGDIDIVSIDDQKETN